MISIYYTIITLTIIGFIYRNEIAMRLAEAMPITSDFAMYLTVAAVISAVILFLKIFTDYYQDSVCPTSTKGSYRFIKVENGWKVQILIHDYFFTKEWYTYMDTIFDDKESAFNEFMYSDNIFKIEDDFIVNKILRIRLLYEIESKNLGQIQK